MLRDTTPSTSLSNQSSLERVGSVSPVYQDGNTRSENVPATLTNARQDSVETRSSRALSTDGDSPRKSLSLKRTASGEVKVFGKHHWSALEDAKQYGHSRNSSTASKSSQVSEISHELRTRLSYAMFKVQNGLQLYSLNEIEVMARPKASSSSTLPQLQRPVASPQSPTSHLKRPSKGLQAIRGSPPGPRTAYESLETSCPPSFHRADIADGVILQNHATPAIQKPNSALHSPYRRPALEPPVDILPRNARSTYAHNAKLPSLNTNGILRKGTVDALLPSHQSTTPTTPPRRPAATMRTPSQKAAMEKDAVETLMFMSSPGNSGHHPVSYGTTSPVPNLTVTSPKRIGFAPVMNRTNLQSPYMKQPLKPAKLATAADIDRALDEMPDHYSSSDDESPLA
ncbi:MAG: hypothetical protein Q9216_003957 [Gyalolechia sp. 2 TL-2023]